MTNIFDQILSQRHTYDFHLAHEMAEQAIDTQDYGQSLRICQKALTKANEQNVPTWISLFEDLAAKVKQKLETMQNSKEFTNAKYSNPNSTPVDDLSILSGVGPTIAQKLSNAGYLTVEQLFNAKPNELAKINGIGVESAGRIIQSAKKYFSGSIRKSHETLGKVSELNNTDCLKSEKQHNIINSLDSKAPKQLETKETNEIPQISSVSSGTPKCDIILESRISHDDVKSKNIEQDYQVIENEGINLEKKDQSSLSITSIQSKLKEFGYTFLSKKTLFSNNFPGINEIACKLIDISQYKQVLLMIPLKFFLTEKRILVSEEHISIYNQKEKGIIENSSGVIFPLTRLSNILYERVMMDNRTQKIVSFFLQQELTSQKTSKNGVSTLIIGGTNTLVHIEPLIIMNLTPGFEEKAIPFAYQRKNNLHVVSLKDLIRLTGFIEKKIYYIETYALSHRDTNTNDSLILNFNRVIRHFSYPFIGFGLAFGFILMLGFYNILKFFITIGYASSIFYIGGVLLLYLRLRKESTKINTQFAQQLDYNSLIFNEEDLIYIKEELTQDEMAQFAYECFGKANRYDILETVEKKQLEQLTIPDLQKKEAKKPITKTFPNTQPMVNNTENPLIEKYSKFLED